MAKTLEKYGMSQPMNTQLLHNRKINPATEQEQSQNTIPILVPRSIEVNGVLYPGRSGQDKAHAQKIQLREVNQRNWSRVGTGTCTNVGAPGTKCFVKQYIDRTKTPHREHLKYEYEGALAAHRILGKIVTVPPLLFTDKRHLLNVFEHIELITIDELLRLDDKLFWQYYPLLLEKLSDVLQAMQTAATSGDYDTFPVKMRNYHSRGLAVNFKGFEIRNTGYKLPLDIHNTEVPNNYLPSVVMFDFVRPYIAPIEEAAAKLLVSIGFLNWGKPLSRFITGPDMEMLDMALYYTGHWTNREAMLSELKVQNGFRFDTIKGANRSEAGLKKIGLNLIGRIYLNKLEKWTLENFS
jgi:hypothetical protein